MTKEISLDDDRCSQIAKLLYKKDPSVIALYAIVQEHISRVHQLNDLTDFNRFYLVLDHLGALMEGRRDLCDLAL